MPGLSSHSSSPVDSQKGAAKVGVQSGAMISGRSRLYRLPGFQIASTGRYLPDKIVSNEDLADLGCDSDWIFQRTGILARRNALPDQACSDLAYEAAKNCLANADVHPNEVDLVIVATITADHSTPSTACLVQDRLGCTAPAMDLGAACSGFVYALVTGAMYVRGGMAKRALVIGSEVMSRTVDPKEVKTYPLFGDGAGAVLLTPLDDPDAGGLMGYSLGSDGAGGPTLCVKAGGSRNPISVDAIQAGDQYMRMDGRAIFKWAVRLIQDTCNDVLQFCDVSPDQVTHAVLHQANTRILEAAANQVGLSKEALIQNLDRFGNTSAASIPIVLDELVEANRIRRGDQLLMCGFGAGLTWGTGLMQW